jgi:hypothetical protein
LGTSPLYRPILSILGILCQSAAGLPAYFLGKRESEMQCSFLEVLIFKNLASMQHFKRKSAKWDNYKVVNFP